MSSTIKDILTVVEDEFPYILEQNVSIQLKSNNKTVVRANVYRPKNGQNAPVIMTYGPYGKDTPYKEQVFFSEARTSQAVI